MYSPSARYNGNSASYDNLYSLPASPSRGGAGSYNSPNRSTSRIYTPYYSTAGSTPVTENFRSHSSPGTYRSHMVVGRSRPQFENDLWSGYRYPPLRTESPDRGRRPADDGKLRVQTVYMMKDQNEKQHHTDRYDLPNLVVRRGQSFMFQVIFSRPPVKGEESIKIQLTTGSKPQQSKGSLIRLDPLPANSRVDNDDWELILDKEQGASLLYSALPANDALVGEYKLYVEMIAKGGDGKRSVTRHLHKQTFYLIFNPWCKEDTVFMENAEEREEYVLNDFGRVYVGTSDDITGRPWYFGQFEDVSLPAACRLLDQSILDKIGHGNPVRVARTISSMANSESMPNGVLTGNWGGPYYPYVTPTQWNGSVAILARYMKGRRYGDTVKYGQCWVFSGLCTSLGRALGIPTRSVTNFESAHDTDKSMTIDTHVNTRGQSLSHLDDSVWNFHVWNEAWFRRPDLPDGFDGWQAFDATPQEQSTTQVGRGKEITAMQCGPAPVKGIKMGHVYLLYDSDFVFAEVNGDRVTWEVNDSGDLCPIRLDPQSVGKFISTKAVGKDERMDITKQYKYPEGTKEERDSMSRAARHNQSRNKVKQRAVKHLHRGQVDITLDLEGDKQEDGSVVIRLMVQNQKNNGFTLKTYWFLQARYYNGTIGKTLRERQETIKLEGNESKTLTWSLHARDYLPQLDADASMRGYVMAHVLETGSKYIDFKLFNIKKPIINIKVSPPRVRVGQEFHAQISFKNPLAIPLSDGVIHLEGAGITREKKIHLKQTLRPGDTFTEDIRLTAQSKGKKQREILAHLSTLQFDNILGSATVEVTQ